MINSMWAYDVWQGNTTSVGGSRAIQSRYPSKISMYVHNIVSSNDGTAVKELVPPLFWG
jgi:hypothetical protein